MRSVREVALPCLDEPEVLIRHGHLHPGDAAIDGITKDCAPCLQTVGGAGPQAGALTATWFVDPDDPEHGGRADTPLAPQLLVVRINDQVPYRLPARLRRRPSVTASSRCSASGRILKLVPSGA
jgi:hypothetical protein